MLIDDDFYNGSIIEKIVILSSYSSRSLEVFKKIFQANKNKNIVNIVCLHVLLFISHVHDSSSLYGLMQVYHSVTISWHRISILFRFHNEVKEKTTIKLEATSILPFNMCVWIFSCPCINCWFHRLLMEWNKPWMMLTLLFQYSIP